MTAASEVPMKEICLPVYTRFEMWFLGWLVTEGGRDEYLVSYTPPIELNGPSDGGLAKIDISANRIMLQRRYGWTTKRAAKSIFLYEFEGWVVDDSDAEKLIESGVLCRHPNPMANALLEWRERAASISGV